MRLDPTLRRFSRWWAVILVSGLAAACDAYFADPSGVDSGGLDVSFNLAAVVPGGPPAAFDAVNQADVRIYGRGEFPIYEAVLPVSRRGGDLSVRVGIDPELTDASYFVSVDLLAGEARLFEGSGEVTMAAGSVPSVEIQLFPIIDRIEPPSSPVELTVLGQQMQLEAHAVFATGHVIPGIPITYTALSQGVIDLSSSGLVIAREVGEALVEARYNQHSVTFPVTVRQQVSFVTVSPGQAMLYLGRSRPFSARAYDANETLIVGRPIEWSTSNRNGLAITPTGMVTGLLPGTYDVIATVDGVEGVATLEVTSTLHPPLAETLITESEWVLRGYVDGHGVEFEYWFEWGWYPDLVDAYVSDTLRAEAAGSFELNIGLDWPPDDMYYRIVAANDAGVSYGEILWIDRPGGPTFGQGDTGGT